MAMNMKIIVSVVFLLLFSFKVDGGALSYDFYQKSCPQLENIIKTTLQVIFLNDPSSPAALLRLMFHDCQVQGCDASILVDPSEQNQRIEINSDKNFGIRKREVITMMKSLVEAQCPQQVSCADILILAAREAVSLSGGPWINVTLGRRDSSNAPSYKLADALLPAATTTGVDDMIKIFSKKGMTLEESVAILGAHTLGITHCSNLEKRLHNPNGNEANKMEPVFAAIVRSSCPAGALTSNFSFIPNDPTFFVFDNQYFTSAMRGQGVLKIDAEMVSDQRTSHVMERFSADQDGFFRAFSSAFVKLSSSGVLTGNQGVIRKQCNVIN